MLELKDVRVAYGNIEVLHKINIEVKDGEIVTIIGANGAGKTTTLRSTAGLLPKKKGSSIIFDGKDITNMGAEKIVAEGTAYLPGSDCTGQPGDGCLLKIQGQRGRGPGLKERL